MFWIISGEGIFHGLANATHAPVFTFVSNQLHHTPWNGFTFYDLIFPLFIFIAGVSMPFSFGRQLEQAENIRAVKHKIFFSLVRRTLLLLFFGMVVNGLLKWEDYENTRFASVLGRIALSCFFAAIIFLTTSLRGQLLWFAALLLGYWAAMALIPVPGFGAGVYTPEGNLEAYVDRLLLPGKLHRKVYDPEGIFSTIPAVATALLGIFTGSFLRGQHYPWKPLKKALVLFTAGIVLLAAGLIWGLVFPVNKNMWTSSFVLFSGGWSLLLFSLFFLVIDVAGIRKWSLPFVWIGSNSILIYLAAHGVVDFKATATFLFGGLFRRAGVEWQQVWLWTIIAFIQVALLYFLYKKKIFLKL